MDRASAMSQLTLGLALGLLLLGSCNGYGDTGSPLFNHSGGNFPGDVEYSYVADKDLNEDCNNDCSFLWSRRDKNGTCSCGSTLHESVFCKLNQTHCGSSKVGILDCSCMTEYEKQVVVGHCFYNCENGSAASKSRINRVYHKINTPTQNIQLENLTERVCGYLNREGRLCGKCKPNHHPPVYSYDYKCIKCAHQWSHWFRFAAQAFLPSTVFLLFILIFKISATSAQLSMFVLFSQNFTIPSNVRVFLSATEAGRFSKLFTHTFVTMYSIWNLDFFRSLYPPLCLHVSTMHIMLLEYIIAFYPMFLLLLMCLAAKFRVTRIRVVALVWNPIYAMMNLIHRTWSFKRSFVDTFATFFILSYSKLLSISFHSLMYSSLHNVNGTRVVNCVYSDCSLDYFGKDHWYYGVLSYIIFISCVFLPMILMFIYPMRWFHRCLTRCNVNQELLRSFMDSFQGCYKDGTNGTRDCRYFAGVYLLLRIILFVAFGITLTGLFYAVITIIFIVMGILIITVRPYKQKYAIYNKVDAIMILIQALSTASILCNTFADIKGERFKSFSMFLVGFFNTLPLIYIVFITSRWIYRHSMICQQLQRKIKFLRASEGESLLNTTDKSYYESIN